jgi:hypothetical protein
LATRRKLAILRKGDGKLGSPEKAGNPQKGRQRKLAKSGESWQFSEIEPAKVGNPEKVGNLNVLP